MIEKDPDWLSKLKGIPIWIKAFIAFVTVLMGFVALWRENSQTVTFIVLVVGFLTVWLSSVFIAFKRTQPLVYGGKGTWQYPRWRQLALIVVATVPIVFSSSVAYYFYTLNQKPDKILILVADFGGPNTDNYRVTEILLGQLRYALESYEYIEIRPLGRAISEVEGSSFAEQEGEKNKASIVIWGWYGVTDNSALVSVHVEVLNSYKSLLSLHSQTKGSIQIVPISELNSFVFQTKLSENLAQLTHTILGIISNADGNADDAIIHFTEALALNESTSLHSYIRKSDLFLLRALSYKGNLQNEEAAADFEVAIVEYSRILETESDNQRILLWRGVALNGANKFDLAILDFNRALDIDPKLISAYIHRGFSYIGIGEYKQAISDFDQAIAMKPDQYNSLGIYYGRASSYLALGYSNPTLECNTIVYDESMYIQKQALLSCFLISDFFDQALADSNKALQLGKSFAAAYTQRGYIYSTIGNYDKAVIDFNTAIEIDPDYRYSYLFRGIGYTRIREYDKAYQDLNEFIKLYPDDTLISYAYLARGETCLQSYTRGGLSPNVAISSIADLDSPAALAGLSSGDIIVRINDNEIQTMDDVRSQIWNNLDREISLLIWRDNNLIEFKLTPRSDRQPQQGAVGLGLSISPPLACFNDLNQSMQLKSDAVEVYILRGLAYHIQSTWDKADADFNKAETIQPDNALIYLAKEDYFKLRQMKIGPNLKRYVESVLQNQSK